MGDERLRTLERQWKESGSTEDESAYLLEALRLGVVPADRLDLAADLGHPAARMALELEPFQLKDLPKAANFLRQRWGQWQLVRASLFATRRIVPAEDVPMSALGLEVRRVLDAVEEWLRNSQSTRPVWQARRGLRREDLEAWSSPAFAGAVWETVGTVVSPPGQGAPGTRSCFAMHHVATVLGLDGLHSALAEDLIPLVLSGTT